uniref:vacuolar fusion protein CCZ1 homolog n=1 Tax=Styela clava TaxID=7725 RepID=UPI00193A2D1B|nr:vacuolar fusion protein CCZ1 homolog [Styela clava]
MIPILTDSIFIFPHIIKVQFLFLEVILVLNIHFSSSIFKYCIYNTTINDLLSLNRCNMATAKLSSFLIYNPTYGPKEGQEHLKVLFYYPESEHPDVKINKVGLCEALIQFAKTYSPSKPCETLHTQKHKQVFYEAEENFWFVMTVSNPWKETMRDGKPVREYFEENIRSVVLKSVLEQAYFMFKLFMGTIENIVANEDIEHLKNKLQDFYLKYLPDINIHHCDILNVHNGIDYFPLQKSTYLKIQSFINSIKSNFPSIQHVMALYADKLIWSDLQKTDSRYLYSYLVNKLLPTSSEFENSVISNYLTRDGSYGRFLAGVRYYEHSTDRHTTTVYITSTSMKGEKLFMVTYQVLNISMTLLFEGETPPSVDTFRKLDSFMGKALIDLSTEMEVVPMKNSYDSNDTAYKYIYFNQESLLVKSSCHYRDNNGFMKCSMSKDVMRVVLTMCQEFLSKTSEVEVITKASMDYWIVGKKTEQHECYIVVNRKDANLIDVNDDVRKICANNITNISLAE